MDTVGLSILSCLVFLGTTYGNPNDTVQEAVTASNATDEGDGINNADWKFENTTAVDTRRILYGKKVTPGARPYMVYLSLTKESQKSQKYRGWLCGGVILANYYVLTSAACVEDADKLYVISGTTKFSDGSESKGSNSCACKHKRKVVWKCVPKNYKFDFADSVKWSANDIAVIRVDKPFKFGVIEKGCEFATDLICYNNISRELEKPGTKGFILGWGSGSNFREGVYRRQTPHIPDNSKCLQEAKVCIMDNEQCAKKWAQKFRTIIKEYMICTKDVMKRLSEICNKKYANCTDVESRRIIPDDDGVDENNIHVDLGRHLKDPDDYTARRSTKIGGFCENDHGGPLVINYKNQERVIGVISACKIDPKTHACHGPFLYTSVFANRQFLSCAIKKEAETNCRRVFRTGITHEEYEVDWDNYKDDDDNDDDDDVDENVLRARVENEKTEVTNKGPESKAEVNSSSTDHPTENTEAPKRKREARFKRSAPNADEEPFYMSSRDENVNEPDDE